MATQEARSRWRTRIDVAAAVVAIVAGSLVIYRQFHRLPPERTGPTRPEPTLRPEPPIPTEPVTINGAAMKGAEDAPLTMVVFADFECPACGHFARNGLPRVKQEYVDKGKLRLGFAHFPLPQHARAKVAARSAECASRAGKFWEMHDLLFANQNDLSEDGLKTLASRAGLPRFEQCLSDKSMDERVQDQLVSARALNVSRTPTVFLGTPTSDGRLQVLHRWSGSRGFDSIAEMIDPLLGKANGSR